ncbi:MAG: hypothetical protein V1779_14585 [bacterium]
MTIEYIIELDKKKTVYYQVDLNRKYEVMEPEDTPEKWVLLDFHKCPVCSLNSKKSKFCPVALDIQDILDLFKTIKSYEYVQVTVNTNERTYFKECDAQIVVGSLFGLIMATSHCPILCKLKPMAIFHLPFSTYEETLARTIGFYLLSDYLKTKNGEEPDTKLLGLRKLYKELEIINRSLKNRISEASLEDSSVNAIVNFFSLSILIEKSLNEQVEDLKDYIEMF